MAFVSLIVYAISMLIRPHEWGVLSNSTSTIVQNSLILCMVLFIFNQNKNLTVPQLPLMALLTLIVFISIVATGWVGGALIQVEQFARSVFIPFVLISGLADSLKKQQILFIIVMVASLIMVLNGHVQVTNDTGIGLAGNPAYGNINELRITYIGILSDPNDLGMFLIMSLPIFFYFRAKSTVFLSPIFWAGIVTVIYGIYLTNSRGTMLGLLVLVLFWLWRKYGTTKSVFIGLAMSPAILFVFSNFREISAEEDSAHGRLEAWYAGLEMLLSNPLFGVGQGNFAEHHIRTAHNSFVLAFSELGIIGCLAWVAILVVTVVSLLNIADKKFLPRYGPLSDQYLATANQESKIAVAMLYSFVAFFVSGFFLSRTYIPILYFFLGMAAACLGRVRRAYPDISLEVICHPGMVTRIALVITFGGTIAIYVIGKLFL